MNSSPHSPPLLAFIIAHTIGFIHTSRDIYRKREEAPEPNPRRALLRPFRLSQLWPPRASCRTGLPPPSRNSLPAQQCREERCRYRTLCPEGVVHWKEHQRQAGRTCDCQSYGGRKGGVVPHHSAQAKDRRSLLWKPLVCGPLPEADSHLDREMLTVIS